MALRLCFPRIVHVAYYSAQPRPRHHPLFSSPSLPCRPQITHKSRHCVKASRTMQDCVQPALPLARSIPFDTIASHFSFSFNRYYSCIYIPNSCWLRDKSNNNREVHSQSFVHVPAVFRVRVSLPSPLFSLSSFLFPSLQPVQTFPCRTTLPRSQPTTGAHPRLSLGTSFTQFQSPWWPRLQFLQPPLPPPQLFSPASAACRTTEIQTPAARTRKGPSTTSGDRWASP